MASNSRDCVVTPDRKKTRNDRRNNPLRDVPRDPEELKAAYESGNHEWRRAFIESLVDQVVVGPGVRGLNRFDPGRIKITYRA